jgi:hypothetical protein
VVSEKALPGVATYPELCGEPGDGVVNTTPVGAPAPFATDPGPATGVLVAVIGVGITDEFVPALELTTVYVP